MRDVVGHLRGVRIAGYDVVRIVLGLLLLLAAALKGHQLATEPVAGAGLLDSRWFLIGVVEFELFFGLWLLAGLCPKWTWAAALGCFALFAGVSLWKALSGEATCGCFGRVPVNPWYTFMLDTAAVTALLRWHPRGLSQFSWSENGTVPLGIRAWAVMAAWLAVGVPAAVAMGSYQAGTITESGDILGDSEFVVLEPEKWTGKWLPLLDDIEDHPGSLGPGEKPLRENLAEGEWVVILYHHDCPKCQEVIKTYRWLAAKGGSDSSRRRVALIEMPPYEDSNRREVLRQASCWLGRLSDTKQWFVSAPVEVILRRGRVFQTAQEKPSVELRAREPQI